MAENNSAASSSQVSWRPKVLVLDDEWTTLERIRTALIDSYQVSVASRAQEAFHIMEEESFDVVITNVRMPDMDGLDLVGDLKGRFPEVQYILMTAFSDIEETISAIRLGVADYLRKPFTVSEVRHALNRCLEQQRLRREVATLRAGEHINLDNVVAKDGSMRDLLSLAETVAGTDATVLISGETGTGKGVLARAIHNTSPRAKRPFVEINCAAIPAALIESELFGHERGSFTGAVARKLGKVETASGGTLLLDEVGDMPMDMQAKLLRFLQNFNFERVGGTKKLHADVRVIAATNRDLKKAVRQGGFRLDLFYRLHVVSLHIPPLRQRQEDIPVLAQLFLQRFCLKYKRKANDFSPGAYAQLMTHSWPGNVRELEHTVERGVILCRSGRVERLDMDASPTLSQKESSGLTDWSLQMPDPDGHELSGFIAQCEKQYLSTLLRKHEGKINLTAKAAGVNPKTLYLKMGRYGLRKQDFRPQRPAAESRGGPQEAEPQPSKRGGEDAAGGSQEKEAQNPQGT